MQNIYLDYLRIMEKNNFRLISLIFLSYFLCSSKITANEIFFNKDFFYPGDTLSVKVVRSSATGEQIKCFWNGREYPSFPIGESLARALLPIPANTNAGKNELRISIPQEAERKYLIEIKAKKFPEERVAFSQEKMELLTLPENEKQRELILNTLKMCSEKQIWQGKFIFPTRGRISSVYGMRRSAKNFHKGVDISTSSYTPVFAPNKGIVLLATQLNLQGNTVIIDHGQGVCTVYYHLSSFAVKPGQIITQGEKIGEVGDTGLATAPHLHWGLYIHGEAVDPLVWLKEEF